MNVRACVREHAGAEIHVTSIKIKNIYIVHDFFIRKKLSHVHFHCNCEQGVSEDC
jgi:hypothetical protein